MNKVMLIGNVGQDPEVRYVEQGVAVARLRLATTERGYTLQNGTQVPDHTDWHNVILWRRLAEIVEKYVHKGDKLYIEGRIRTRQWTDQTGNKRYQTEIEADTIQLLGRRDEVPGQQQGGYQGGYQGAPAPAPRPAAAPAPAPAPAQEAPIDLMGDNGSDDLPF